MTAKTAPPAEEHARRLTHSQIIEQLVHALARGGQDHSTIELTRNARGDTQIRVSVRTGETAELATPRAAMEHALELYEELAAKYPQGLGAISAADLQAELAARAERAR